MSGENIVVRDENIVGRIMDKAATADRRALFAALQAALGPIIDAKYGRVDEGGLERVEKALDLGAPYGSPEHLASLSGHVVVTDPPESTDS